VTTFGTAGTAANTGPSRRRAPFFAEARLGRVEAEAAHAVVAAIAGRLAPHLDAEARHVLGRLDDLAGAVLGAAGSGAPCAVTSVGVGAGLDLAAELLEGADVLAARGWPLESFALEGIEGRLLEALLDASGVADGVCGDVGGSLGL
jgi:hypothetical protein